MTIKTFFVYAGLGFVTAGAGLFAVLSAWSAFLRDWESLIVCSSIFAAFIIVAFLAAGHTED
jgi:hypothetical protein